MKDLYTKSYKKEPPPPKKKKGRFFGTQVGLRARWPVEEDARRRGLEPGHRRHEGRAARGQHELVIVELAWRVFGTLELLAVDG